MVLTWHCLIKIGILHYIMLVLMYVTLNTFLMYLCMNDCCRLKLNYHILCFLNLITSGIPHFSVCFPILLFIVQSPYLFFFFLLNRPFCDNLSLFGRLSLRPYLISAILYYVLAQLPTPSLRSVKPSWHVLQAFVEWPCCYLFIHCFWLFFYS